MKHIYLHKKHLYNFLFVNFLVKIKHQLMTFVGQHISDFIPLPKHQPNKCWHQPTGNINPPQLSTNLHLQVVCWIYPQ